PPNGCDVLPVRPAARAGARSAVPARSAPLRRPPDPGTTRPPRTVAPARSHHREIEQRLDGAPLLAARALPMMAACAEAALAATVAGIAHQQLLGDELEVLQGHHRIAAAVVGERQ